MDRKDFNMAVERLIAETLDLIPTELQPDLACIPDAADVPDWHDFEHRIWKNGEAIRMLIHTERKNLNRAQICGILGICGNINAKRGRESFVMLLGKKEYAEYAPHIAELLNDRYVEGHAVYTLYKMGAADYTAEIARFQTHKKSWIRNYAKKYIQKYGVN